MRARTTLLGLVMGLGMLILTGAAPDRAEAQCCAPPPPCCTPPPPPPCCQTPPAPPCCIPPPPPPSAPPCCTPGHNVNIPGVNVFVGATAIVNVSASATASASASGSGTGTGSGSGSGSGSGGGMFFGGGGGGGGYAPPMATGVIQLSLEQPRRKKRVAYEAKRTVTKRVVIQAVCIDDRTIPHPASQTFGDRDVEGAFDGELYRCLAGSWLQATIAEHGGEVDFSKGQTLVCRKGEALYHGAGGKVECRPQKPGRECHERSLLRRFGAGIKILTMTIVETYTAYREEEERVETVATSMSLDGGVGGTVY